MKVKEVFRKLVRVQMPSKLTPGEYVRHAALLLFASILYGVVLHIATGPILGFFASTQPALTALGLFYALFVITWKCRALAQYIHWRLKPQVQNETAQALIYASFVSTGYLTLADRKSVV